MDIHESIKLLLEGEQQFANRLTACKENPEYDPRYTALAISKAEEIFKKILEAQDELLAALERYEGRLKADQNSPAPP